MRNEHSGVISRRRGRSPAVDGPEASTKHSFVVEVRWAPPGHVFRGGKYAAHVTRSRCLCLQIREDGLASGFVKACTLRLRAGPSATPPRASTLRLRLPTCSDAARRCTRGRPCERSVSASLSSHSAQARPTLLPPPPFAGPPHPPPTLPNPPRAVPGGATRQRRPHPPVRAVPPRKRRPKVVLPRGEVRQNDEGSRSNENTLSKN